MCSTVMCIAFKVSLAVVNVFKSILRFVFFLYMAYVSENLCYRYVCVCVSVCVLEYIKTFNVC